MFFFYRSWACWIIGKYLYTWNYDAGLEKNYVAFDAGKFVAIRLKLPDDAHNIGPIHLDAIKRANVDDFAMDTNF